MHDTRLEDPWFKIITLINRALLLTEDRVEAAHLKIALHHARQEAQNLSEPLPVSPIRWH